MAEPALDAVYAVIFIDAINVKIREGRSPTGRSTSRWGFRQLAPALLATADLMREAHALLGVEGPVPQVDIQATRPGSFIIDLLVADPKLPQQVLNVLTSKGATAAVNLGSMVGFVVGSFGTVNKLRNKKITRTEEASLITAADVGACRGWAECQPVGGFVVGQGLALPDP